MRVAFDIAQTAGERAGCAWYADGLGRALARRGDLQLDLYPHFDQWLNSSVASATLANRAQVMLAGATLDEIRALWKSAGEAGLPGRPDIVHAHSFQAPAVAGSRLVFTIHDLGFWSHPACVSEASRLHCQRGTLDALERAAGLVFVSEAARREFETVLPGWLHQTGRPHAIIPGASRFGAQPRRETVANDAPWLCVGSIEPRKDHATLLDSYALYRRRVSQPRPLVLIGGRGWMSDAIHRRIEAADATSGVHYLGYVPDDVLGRHYRDAFALVQPSRHEGFGLPVVEAFGFGVPVICSDIPSLREVARGAAWWFPAGSAEALADRMVTLHDRPDAHGQASELAARAAPRYSWDDSAARAVVFYRSLVEHRD